MVRKLLLVNNGLKDLNGHYFETAVSIADAARQLGCRPILAAHATCPADIIPDWLEFYPRCRTDHWMMTPIPPGADADHAPRLTTRWARARARLLALFSPPIVAPADDAPRQDLERSGFGGEVVPGELFQHDLELLLRLTEVGRDDHVFLLTAHGRELAAIQRIVARLRPRATPTFHLEFRHDLDLSEPVSGDDGVHPYRALHGLYFAHFRRGSPSARIKLYTDTEELSADYARSTGLRFTTLPIPFRTEFLATRTGRPGEPLRITFLGDVRDEKGFFLLPDLIEALANDYLATGKVRFVIQASLTNPGGNQQSHAALLRLRHLDPAHVTLAGLDGPLSPGAYYQLAAAADVLLCPYNAHAYRRRSSGTFAEAVAAGVPTVVPRGTWLERWQPAGAGEAFTDLASLVTATRRVCDDYPRYLRHAVARRAAWLAVHTPARLVRSLVNQDGVVDWEDPFSKIA